MLPDEGPLHFYAGTSMGSVLRGLVYSHSCSGEDDNGCCAEGTVFHSTWGQLAYTTAGGALAPELCGYFLHLFCALFCSVLAYQAFLDS